jgi:hypothetical protein
MPDTIAALQLAQASTDPDLGKLVANASPAQQQALLRALQEAHAAGQQEAEARTGRIIAQVLAPLLGVAQPTAGSKGSSHRLSRIVGLLRGAAR